MASMVAVLTHTLVGSAIIIIRIEMLLLIEMHEHCSCHAVSAW